MPVESAIPGGPTMATRTVVSSSWFVFVPALLLLALLGGCGEEGGPAGPTDAINTSGDAASDPRGPETTSAVPGPVGFQRAFDLVTEDACVFPDGNYARFARRMTSPEEGEHLLTADAGFEPCNDAPDDVANSFTWVREGDRFAWSATVPVGAVILQSGSASRVFVYGQRSWGDGGLAGPPDATTGAPLPVDAVVVCHDYAVKVTAEIEARLVTRTDWSMHGSIEGESWDLFPGEQATSRVDLRLVAGAPVAEPATAVGTVAITNASPIPARVSSVTNFFSGGYIIPIQFPGGLPADLAPGEVLVGQYWQPFPNQQSRTNNVTVNCVGEVLGGSARAQLEFGERVFENATATVISSDGQSFGPFTTTTSFAVERTFEVDATDAPLTEIPWTLSFFEDQGQFSTVVTLRRHAPLLELSATTQFVRTWDWSLEHGLFGEAFETRSASGASVRAWLRAWTDDGTDTDFGVRAHLRLLNPHPARALELASSGLVLGVAPHPAYADGASIGAGQDGVLDLEVALAGREEGAAVARVGYVTYRFAPDGSASALGVMEMEASVALAFDEPSTEIDAGAWLGDTLVGDLGQAHADDGEVLVEYLVPLDSAAECGTSWVEGTGRLRTFDTDTLRMAPYRVRVDVDCGELAGCTRGRGYWIRHRDDAAWGAVVAEASAWFSPRGRSIRDVLRSTPRRDPYWKLAAAWIIARLNQHAGADASVVEAELAAAARLLDQNAHPTRCETPTAEWRRLAEVLQDFNEGRIGPGACKD